MNGCVLPDIGQHKLSVFRDIHRYIVHQNLVDLIPRIGRNIYHNVTPGADTISSLKSDSSVIPRCCSYIVCIKNRVAAFPEAIHHCIINTIIAACHCNRQLMSFIFLCIWNRNLPHSCGHFSVRSKTTCIQSIGINRFAIQHKSQVTVLSPISQWLHATIQRHARSVKCKSIRSIVTLRTSISKILVLRVLHMLYPVCVFI